MKLPDKGTGRAALLETMDRMHAGDCDWRGGKTFGYIYNAGDEVNELLEEVNRRFLHTNALSLTAFPSLRRMEAEVVAMASDLLHAPEPAGSVTSGGTESILMAVKTARELARAERGITEPNMVVPMSAHPAFEKAAHYFGVRAIRTPVRDDLRADVDAMRAAIDDDTILLVGSAPGFPHGVIDPIAEIGALAAERGLLCHVDACLGGYMLPFAEAAGYPIPPFDFRVEGVTSMSADLHKYGYASKGASTVLYRSRALRKRQFFVYVDWPGGIYASPSAAGARGGAPLAAAWAVLNFLGKEGFTRLADTSMKATARILDGIRAIDGLQVMGEPDMSVFAFRSTTLDVYALADAMEQRGWVLDRLQKPSALHMMVSPKHAEIADTFLADLRACADAVRDQPPPSTGMAAVYGMLAAVPDRRMVEQTVLDFMDGWYKVTD
jgi:sphinganine-1-phosphate aldolase